MYPSAPEDPPCLGTAAIAPCRRLAPPSVREACLHTPGCPEYVVIALKKYGILPAKAETGRKPSSQEKNA